MGHTEAGAQTIDVTGLSADAIAAVQTLVLLLRQRREQTEWLPPGIKSREEWIKAIREYADSHEPINHFVDWSRESIYGPDE